MISAPMTFQWKLRSTLIQTFGAAVPGESRASVDPHERLTAVGGSAPLEDRLPVEGDIIGGHYRLVRSLGVGTFGRVYVAERTDVPEHRVALKVIHRAVFGGRDVERELVMLAGTTHPHIVQLKDHGMTSDYVWLTMPLYDGETLEERLSRGPLTLSEAYDVFLPIARGVHALHERGLRHQDIKPENIFLAEIGGLVHPVLLDLGVAVESGSPFVAGTALYGSPEQIASLGGLEGRSELSEKMDTYCLAATLLRSLVGPDEFPGERASSPFDIANAFEVREVCPLTEAVLSELTGDARTKLQVCFSRWLTRDPDARPDTGAFADELEVLREQEREAAAAIEAEIAQQKVALKRVRVALFLAALAATGVALWGLAHRETLRLARELEHARSAGADSFDKLDTCAAAHRLAQQQVRTCAVERTDDRARQTTTLQDQRATHAAIVARLESTRDDTAGRFRRCVDEKHRAAQACTSEHEKLTTDIVDGDRVLASIRVDLSKMQRDRDEQAARRATCVERFEAHRAEQTVCNEQLASCVLERDARKSVSVASGVAAPPLTDAGDGAGVVGGSASTSTTVSGPAAATFGESPDTPVVSETAVP